MGLLSKLGFDKLKNGLSKTRAAVVDAIGSIVGRHPAIDESLYEQIEDVLLSGDVGVEPTQRIMTSLRSRVKAGRLTDSAVLPAIVQEEIGKMLPAGSDVDPFESALPAKPYIILVVGVNGVGKTTTIGKLASRFQSAGKKVLIAAADTFRAAANEQLEIWAKRANVEILQQASGADPGAVAYDSVKHAVSKGLDIVLIDTAGRLHTKSNLMDELKKIRRVITKVLPGAPHETLLVLDATTGQNAIQQAKEFSAASQVTGLVLTKLDGTAKGGVVIGISSALGVPIRFIGVGEGVEDLQPFDPADFSGALFSNDQTKGNV